MTTLRAKGAKKVGKVGFVMKVSGHISVDFNSDYYKVATNKLETALCWVTSCVHARMMSVSRRPMGTAFEVPDRDRLAVHIGLHEM